jgi:hypothetical protein
MLLGAGGLVVSAGEAAARAGVVAVFVDANGTSPRPTLRAGADVEAGQTIATGQGELVSLLFVDGTSLILGPESTIRIDACAFDAASGKGELALTLRSGVCHLVGGIIGRTGEITLATPAGAVGAHEAIATFSVTPNVTLALVAQGRAREIARAATSRDSLAPGASAQSGWIGMTPTILIVAFFLILLVVAADKEIHERLNELKQKLQSLQQTGAGDPRRPEVDRAFNNVAGFLVPLSKMMNDGAPTGLSASIDREMTNAGLSRRDKRILLEEVRAARLEPGAAGSIARHPPAVVQRISAAITNRPYQATFPPRK